MKSALVVVQGKGRFCTSMCPRHLCIHAQRAIARLACEVSGAVRGLAAGAYQGDLSTD
ncbi:MAG: hypothetical protein P8179_14140 [Candidatus Thiodiazotropha sp.]